MVTTSLRDLDQDFRARAGNRVAAEVEEVEIRRRIGPPQRAIERKRRQRERRLEALCQHDLKGVAGGDVVLGLGTMALYSAGVVLDFGGTSSGPASASPERHIERAVEALDDA